MEVKKLTPAELEGLLPLVWDVFLEYEGMQYPEDGKRAFWNAIHDPAYLSALCAYGAFDGGEASASSPPAAGAAMWPCFS